MNKIYLITIVFLISMILCGCEHYNNPTNSIIEKTSITDNLNTKTSSQASINADFEYVIENNAVTITNYIGNDNAEISVPEEIEGLPVVLIESEAFYRLENLTSVLLPSSLKVINDGAFYKCTNLQDIYIPENVNAINGNPFFRASSLKEIEVSEKNLNFSSLDGVLYNKNKTELIVYPEGSNNEQFTIPDSVIKIHVTAFGHSANFKKIVIPKTVTDLPEECMFVFPDSVTLVVEKGSLAEGYAQKHSLNYELYN